MRCKIVRFQKFMWHNIIRSIKSKKKNSILHYSIDLSQLFQKTDQAGRIRRRSLQLCQALLMGVKDTSGE